MKYYSKKALFVASFLLMIAACSKDLGNYDYRDINELTFNTESAPTTVFFGDTLTIAPEFTATQPVDKGNYTYSWVIRATEISSEPVLKYKITWDPGIYNIELYVKDNTTGVTWQTLYTITVKTLIYEGYMVLNEVNGGSRLDMLSYRENGFVQYTDVLDQMGSALKLKGKPIKVACLLSMVGLFSNSNYTIFLLTDQATNELYPETFGWDEKKDIRYRFLDAVPSGFRADELVVNEYAWPHMYLIRDNKLYYASGQEPFVYQLGKDFSSYSPKLAFASYMGAVYNQQQKKFMKISSGVATDNNEELYPNYPHGLDLVDLFSNHYQSETDANGSSFFPANAILKDPNTGKYKFLRFYIGGGVVYYEDLIAPEIENATHFAASPEINYLFYTVGGKLYQYDLGLKTTKVALDLGGETITLMDFIPFYKNKLGLTNINYAEWGKWLTVASYDPSKPEGSNGTIRQYGVPPVNQPLVEQYKWTGFGKVVSISYRER